MLQVAKCPVVNGLPVAGHSVTWVIHARDTLGGTPVTGAERTRVVSHLRIIPGRLPCNWGESRQSESAGHKSLCLSGRISNGR